MATKKLETKVRTITLREAEDGSLLVAGTWTAQRVYDMPELGTQVREPVSLDLGELYNGLSAADRQAAEKALQAFARGIDRLAEARV